MKLTALKTIALIILSVSSAYASGTTSPTTTPTTTPNSCVGSAQAAQSCAQGAGTCDLTQLKDSLYGTESASSGSHKAIHCGKVMAYGKYQFLPGTLNMLNAYKNASPGCKSLSQYKKVGKNLCHGTGGFPTEACAGTQEAVMDEFTLNNLKWLKNNCPAAVNAVNNGKIVKGYKKSNGAKNYGEPCRVTWSGVLAGAHIGGAQGICNTLGTDKDVDDGYTSRLFYVCKHGGLPVPGEDCNPQEYENTEGDPSTAEPGGWPDGFTPPARTFIPFNGLSDILKYYWVAAFQLMTEDLTTNMMQQVQIIGTFFDAKHQLETQRLMQEKAAQAHKDYQPSTQMCEIGTFVRNLADTEKRADLTATALNRALLDRALASGDSKTAKITSDGATRLKAYTDKFCNTEDNAKQNKKLCENSGPPEQQNADINFTKAIDAPLTLEINLLDDAPKAEEENLFAFLDHIFMTDRFPWLSANQTELFAFIQPYQEMRSLVAMRSVAYNSFANIIAQKTQAPDDKEVSVAPFLKALMREMGMEDDDIEATIGKNPSYFAQMEILSKKIYQHPEFIANLYDKPANVKRLRASMSAIKLMQDRDIHEAMQRREMLMSMLLELKLREKQQALVNSGSVGQVLANPPGTVNKSSGAGGGGGGGGGF